MSLLETDGAGSLLQPSEDLLIFLGACAKGIWAGGTDSQPGRRRHLASRALQRELVRVASNCPESRNSSRWSVLIKVEE